MTPEQRAAIRRLAAERSLLAFVQQAWPYVEPDTDFVGGWHIEAVAAHLEAVASGRIDNLLINIPPGCCKSLLCSVFFPAWVWLRRPSARFMFASYQQELSLRDSMKCRNLVESEWYSRQWGSKTELAPDQNQKTKFDNVSGGWRLATSPGGRGTGEHPDFVVFDDPHNVKGSESHAERQAVLDWWDGTMSSRGITRNCRRVGVMQRLHERDLSGHVLAKGGWEHLCLPMEAEPEAAKTTALGWKDPRTIPGELLWPALLPPEKVDSLKREMGSHRAAGQLQQRPAPAGGGLFKRDWFEIVNAAPVAGKRCRAWDFAATVPKPGRDPDYTVGGKISRSVDGVFYIEHVVRFQGTALQVENTLLNTAASDGVEVSIHIPQDPGQAGKGQSEQMIRRLAGYIVKAETVSGSKEVRAQSFIAQCEAGNVKLVRGPWNEAWLDEVSIFPFGLHDDQVDACTDAFNSLAIAGRSAVQILNQEHGDMRGRASASAQRGRILL